MTRWRKLLFWQRPDLDDELDFYREMREAELRDSGMSHDEARLAARKAIGNLTRIKEEARAAWMVRWLDEFGQDLTYALRSLRASPTFTLMAIGALGLAIGVNTSVFTFFNALALRPWDVQDPARVVSVYQADVRGSRLSYRGLEHPFFEYLRDHTTRLSGITGTRNLGKLIVENQGQRVNTLGAGTSGNYFAVMGIPMALGRAYTAADDQAGIAEPPVVLSYGFWQTHFAGRRDVLGREIAVNRVPLRIIGVTAESFRGTSPDLVGISMPFHAVQLVQPENQFIDRPDSCCVDTFARLQPDVSRAQAQSELTVLAQQWLDVSRRTRHGMLLTPASFFAHPRIREKLSPVLALLALAVLLVLILACANVSNLLLARAAARRKEIAVRLSLGAGRWRLIRQLLTESLVLSLAAALFGLALAGVLPRALMKGFAFSNELSFRLEPDTTVLFFSMLLSLFTTVAFGLLPALQATRVDLTGALKDTAAKLRRWDLRRALAAAQVALCVVLLMGAALLLRGLIHASQSHPGFNTRNLAVIRLDLPLFAYDAPRALALTNALTEKLESLPGVAGVTHTDILPFGNNSNGSNFVPANGKRTLERASVARVAPQHLEMLGIGLLSGRNFTRTDIGRPVAIVNEVAARLAWGGEDPIGRKFRGSGTDYEVIGVMRNSVYRSYDSKLEPTYFVPAAGGLWANYLVRLKDPRQLSLLREAVLALDPHVLPLVNRLEEDTDRALQPSRMAAGIAFGLGGFALLLACVGLYGVVAYNVAQRTKEIGIRMALGAHPREVTRLVLSQNLSAVLGGLVLGIAASAAFSTLLANLIYGVSPFDPLAYTAVTVCLLLSVVAASAIPARRAAGVNPLTALRTE